MIYCTPCAKKNDWPVRENRVHGRGRCEHCKGTGEPLNFTPTEQLLKDFVEAHAEPKKNPLSEGPRVHRSQY